MNLAVDDKCKTDFDNLKFRKQELRYIIYKIVKETIVVEHVGEKHETWETFLEALPDNEYRYGVFDFEFKASDGRLISKLIFVQWCPDSSPIKGRLLYATGKQNFKKFLDLNSKDFSIASKKDVTIHDIEKELEK